MNCKTGLVVVSLVGLLAACETCSTTPASAVPVEVHTKVIDSACSWTKAIYLDKADVLSDATARAVLEHNRAGAKVCGWKPIGK